MPEPPTNNHDANAGARLQPAVLAWAESQLRDMAGPAGIDEHSIKQALGRLQLAGNGSATIGPSLFSEVAKAYNEVTGGADALTRQQQLQHAEAAARGAETRVAAGMLADDWARRFGLGPYADMAASSASSGGRLSASSSAAGTGSAGSGSVGYGSMTGNTLAPMGGLMPQRAFGSAQVFGDWLSSATTSQNDYNRSQIGQTGLSRGVAKGLAKDGFNGTQVLKATRDVKDLHLDVNKSTGNAARVNRADPSGRTMGLVKGYGREQDDLTRQYGQILERMKAARELAATDPARAHEMQRQADEALQKWKDTKAKSNSRITSDIRTKAPVAAQRDAHKLAKDVRDNNEQQQEQLEQRLGATAGRQKAHSLTDTATKPQQANATTDQGNRTQSNLAALIKSRKPTPTAAPTDTKPAAPAPKAPAGPVH